MIHQQEPRMGRRLYRLGKDVQIELISENDGGVSFIDPEKVSQSPNDFGLDLTNFTGRLFVQKLEVDALSTPSQSLGTIAEERKAEGLEIDTEDHEASGPFSLALGEPSPESRIPTPQKKSDDTKPPPPPVDTSEQSSSPRFSTAQQLVAALGFDSPAPTRRSFSDVEESGSTTDDVVTEDEYTTQDDESYSQHGFESNFLARLEFTDDEEDSSKIIEKPKSGKEMFRHLAKKVVHSNRIRKKQGAPSSNWNNLLFLTSVKRRVPSRMRKQRSQARDMFDSEPPPTRLHLLCASPEVTLNELQEALRENPDAVFIKDEKDRLPLHILGDNDALVATLPGKQAATTFGWTLMQAYPEGITTLNCKGHMPFVSLIDDWVQYTYETYKKSRESSKPDRGTTLIGRVRQSIDPGAATANRASQNSNSQVAGSRFNQGSNTQASTESVVPDESPDHKSNITEYSQRAHPSVEMWDEVEWCFSMLSLAMDELGGKNGGLYKVKHRALIHHQVKERNARVTLATHVVRVMPTILKTILLLEEDGADARKRILKMSIIRRILLCPESVGLWLTNMLRRKKAVASRRAVDYMEMVSETTVEDYVGCFRTALSGDHKNFHEERAAVFARVEELEGMIASLVTLERKETERAATTAVVWSVMDKNLRRPFVVGLVLIDFVLHVTLMLAFRNDVSFRGKGEDSAVGNVPTQVVIFICSHYFIRKLVESMSLLRLSVTVFRSYFTNFWTFFDFIAIVLALVAIIWNDKNPNQYRQGFNSFVLGLLWLKVLGFLKVVNKEMSTFILALIQILRDLKYFAVVLAVIIFMFGDMLHIAVSTKDNGLYCVVGESLDELSGPTQDFCSDQVLNSYLRVYALLLGDFELDDWRDTTGITVLFVVFTLLGVVILLNVLIAVISDSYEKAKVQSLLLFGRARVTFVAQNEALETFLRPGSNPMEGLKYFQSNQRKVLVFASRIFRYMVLCAIITTAFAAEIYLVTRAWSFFTTGNIQFVTLITILFLSIVLTMALWVVLNFTIEKAILRHLPVCFQRVFNVINICSSFFVNLVASRLFGLQEKTKISRGDYVNGNEEEEEWTGRITYIERAFDRSLEQAKEDLTSEMMALEKRLYEHHVMMTGTDQPEQTTDDTQPPITPS